MFKLLLRQGDLAPTEIVIAGEVATVGRAAGCDVVIDRPYVSKRHLRILRGVVVVDLGSSNGTFVAGQRIDGATLLDGSEINPGDGDVYIRVEVPQEAAPAIDSTALHGDSEVERLRAENAELRRTLEITRPASPATAKLLEQQRIEVDRLHERIASLESQLSAARARPVPAPAVQPPPLIQAGQSRTRALLAELALHDFDAHGEALDATPEEFLVVQQFKLVRRVERLVTRMAGDFIQIYNANTMLPDVEGNFRELVARVVDPVGDPTARRELTAYAEQLSRWLVASLGAHRQASARFVDQLKQELSESALTAGAPIPAIKRLSGQADAELWRRSSAFLRELTPDRVEERLEKLTRDAALELLGERATGVAD